MKNTHLSIQGIQSFHETPVVTAKSATAYQDLFVELVHILEQLKNLPEASASDGSVERWEDNEHIYLETDLEAIFHSEIDINVHDGRFYVRIER